jgi:type VI secretion system secreted protein Hcp
MSIDNNAIKGEVMSSSHKDWIAVLAWSEGSSNSGTTHMGTGLGAGTINIQGVNVTKWLDSSDPELRLAILTGRRFDEVKIDVIKTCGLGIYTKYAITLNDVLVTSLNSGGSGGEDRLTESVSFDMSSIESMYTPVGPDCRLEQPIYSFQSYN